METGNPERMKKNLEMLKWIKGKDGGGAGAGGAGTGGVEAVTPSIELSFKCFW